MRQYYYRVNDCKADHASSPDCICWHDEGTGPLQPSEVKSWRPAKPRRWTGVEMYEAWQTALRQQGCGTDPWDEIEAMDRVAWDEVAEEVNDGRP